MDSFSYLEPVRCSMSSSNCCFLTCIQVSQLAGPVVWYSHLFQNFPQFVVIHTVKGFGIVNKAEIDVFLKLSCFFDDPADVGNLISGSSAFSKTSLNIWKFMVHILLNQLMTKYLQRTANSQEIESVLYSRNWTLVTCLLYTLVSFTDGNLVSPLFNFSSQFNKLSLGTVPWVPQVAESVCKSKHLARDFLGGNNGEESTCQCRGHRFESWSKKISHAAGQWRPQTKTIDPTCSCYWSPHALEPVFHKKSHCSEMPKHRD